MEVDEAVPPVQTAGGESGGVPGSRKAAATGKKEKKPRGAGWGGGGLVRRL